MKKGLVILMALAFIGGVAFAEDAAMGPDITYGASAYLGVNAVTNNTDLEPTGGTATDRATVSAPLFGPLKDDGDWGYYVAPWVMLESGVFSAKIAPVFYGAGVGGNDIALNRYELTLGLAGTGYGIYDRIRLENKEGGNTATMSHRIKGDFDLDNLSAGVVFSGSYGLGAVGAMGTINDFFTPFPSMVLSDLQFSIMDIWGFVDVKAGGFSTSYYHTNNYRLQAIDWFASDDDNVASSNVADTGFRYTGVKSTTVPVNTTFNIGSLVESVPLTIRTGVNVPLTAVEWRDYLAYDMLTAAYVPIIASAEFMMEGIGDFVLGAIPGIAYTQTAEAGGVYTNSTTDVTNNVFLDANISAVENLQLQASVDFGTQTFDSQDLAETTGTGTAASPITTAKVSASGINFGVEFVYDLSAVMAGLEVDGAIAVASLSGVNALNATGTAWAAPATGAGIYTAANYTEANVWGAPGIGGAGFAGESPFIFGLGVSYDIDDSNSVSLSNEYDSMVGAYKNLGLGLTSNGFYSSDAISVGYSVKAGGGKLSAGLGYKMFLGLPSASDYQITGAENIANYDADLANAYKPLSAYVKYSSKF